MADWPVWKGETAVIVATGPSAKDAPLQEVQGKARLIVVKTSWKLAPWADVLYGCDRGWWVANQGVPEFLGLKVSPAPSVCKVYRDIRQVKLVGVARILMDETGRIGCGLRTGGGHSGFHALNLAVQFGARRIVMVGFDMTLDHGQRWHPNADGMMHRKDIRGMAECREALDECAPQFAELGVDVVNASAISALRNYRRASLGEAVRC